LFFSFLSYGQFVHGDISEILKPNDYHISLPENAPLETHLFKVYIVVVRDNNGNTTVTQNQINQMEAKLNADFATLPTSSALNIQFEFSDCIEFYNDSNLYCNGLNANVLKKINHLDGFTIWIGGTSNNCSVNTNYTGSLPGFASMYVQGSYQGKNPIFTSSYVTHEMGHLLGLFHTYHNTVCSTVETDPYQFQDHCPDTKLEVLSFNIPQGNCAPFNACPNRTDKFVNGDNFMNACPPPCMTKFTNDQCILMRQTIRDNYKHYYNREVAPPDQPIIIEENTNLDNYKTVYNCDRDILITRTTQAIASSTFLLTNATTLRMGDNRSIIIKRGNIMQVSNGKITHGNCAEFWSGISVEGNQNRIQSDNPTALDAAIFNSSNQSVIEFAWTALRTYNQYDSNNPDYWGGLIQCANTRFLNNRRAVSFLLYNKQNRSVFADCTFYSERDNSVGVTIWACREIPFNHCLFDNMKTWGILSYDADIEVSNGCLFTNNEIGVEVNGGMTYFSNAKIYDSFFRGNRYAGINANTSTTLISGNDIQAPFNFISANYGIKIDGRSIYSVVKNRLQGQPAVYINNTGKDIPQFVINNRIHDSFGGNLARGDNDVHYVCNLNDDITFPIILDGNTTNTSIYRWQSGQFAAGNCFLTNSWKWDISTWGTTVPFVYNVAKNAPPCEVPNSTGNFIVNNSIDFGANCDVPTRFKPITIDRFMEINTQLSNSSLSTLIKSDLEIEKSELLISLSDMLYKNNAKVQLNTILNKENNSLLANELQLKYNVLDNNYPKANEIINTMHISDKEKELKYMHLNLLEKGIGSKSLINKEYLKNIAKSDLPERSYARSLYAFVFEEIIKDPKQVFPTIQNANLRRSNTSISDNITISPNPVLDYLNINGLENRKVSNIQVVNLDGKIVKTLNNNFNTIDISNLSSGLYIIKIYDQDNINILTQKIVKQ
jgi:hypothetical protein